MGADSLRIENLDIRVAGLDRAQAAWLGREVARRLSQHMQQAQQARPVGGRVPELSLKLEATPGLSLERLAARIAARVAGALP